MQLSRWLTRAGVPVLVAYGLGVAHAQDAPSDPAPAAASPPGASAPVATPTPSPAPSSDEPEPTADDERDVFDGTPPPHDDGPAGSSNEPPTGTGRFGVYYDSDQTTVLRTLVQASKTWGRWLLNGSVGVDAVTSASIDVRSSPGLSAVDTITTASGRSSTSGGQMTDTRYQAILGGGWKDTSGHAVNLTTAVATERDYDSVNAGVNGAVDVLERNATLLGGITVTDNRIASVLNSDLHRKMWAVGWSAGVARVLTRNDALRLRYDGKASEGYLASPYRNVRFGNWTTTGTSQLTFKNTIGSADGLPETVPESRISHAAVLEWVHALGLGVGLHPEVRLGHDSWGIDSVTGSLDLRVAKPGWRLQLGYRFYHQSQARFFEGKYTLAPTMYTYFTSDKELGRQTGHLGSFDVAKVLVDANGPNDTRMVLNLRVDVFEYSYPGFVLLSSRLSTFAEIGVSWEL